MTQPTPPTRVMAPDEQQDANMRLARYLQRTLDAGAAEVAGLRSKLSITYGIIVILSIIMFALGIVLLSVPALAALGAVGEIGDLQSLIAGGFGIADLAALFLFRPLDRLHGLMGDMSQITLAINSYQSQVALRLMAMDVNQPDSIGSAADAIREATRGSIVLIQTYFEVKKQASS